MLMSHSLAYSEQSQSELRAITLLLDHQLWDDAVTLLKQTLPSVSNYTIVYEGRGLTILPRPLRLHPLINVLCSIGRCSRWQLVTYFPSFFPLSGTYCLTTSGNTPSPLSPSLLSHHHYYHTLTTSTPSLLSNHTITTLTTVAIFSHV